jgi:hypothetical protein
VKSYNLYSSSDLKANEYYRLRLENTSWKYFQQYTQTKYFPHVAREESKLIRDYCLDNKIPIEANRKQSGRKPQAIDYFRSSDYEQPISGGKKPRDSNSTKQSKKSTANLVATSSLEEMNTNANSEKDKSTKGTKSICN